MTLTFVVRNQTLLYIDTKVIPRIGSAKYLELKFKFITKDWIGLRKTLHISAGEYSEPFVLQSDTFQVPTYYTQQSAFTVTLLGDSDDGVVVPTNEVSVALDESNTLWTAVPPDPHNSAYLELLKSIVPSDWAQNDPTAKDYVKNRTHWVDDDGTVPKLDEKFLPDSSAVSFAAQSLTDSQKAQARENIGAQETICGEETAEEVVGTGFRGWVEVSSFSAVTIPKVELKGTIYENIPVSSVSGPTVYYHIGSYSIGFNRVYNNVTISPNDGTTADEFRFYKDVTTVIPIPEKYVPKEVIFVEFYLNSSNNEVMCRKTYDELRTLVYENKYIVVLYSGGEYYWLENTNYSSAIRFVCPNGRAIMIGSDGNNTWEFDNFATESYVKSVALPPVTTADNGKILKVVDGAWAVVDA